MHPVPIGLPPLNSAHRFSHVDAMRAFAVMVVVIAHAGLERAVPGGSGVTIFFAISGFIITWGLLKERDRTGSFSIRGFYWRRIRKLAPPFIVAILVPSLVVAVSGGPISLLAVASQVFFAYNWLFFSDLPILPGSGVTWSLAIEEQFYIAFALIWLAAVRSRHWERVVVVVAGATAVVSSLERFVFAAQGGLSDRIYYGTDTRIDGIAIGILAAVLLRRWQRGAATSRLQVFIGTNWVPILAATLFLSSLVIRDTFFRDTVRFTLQSVAAATFILWGFSPQRSRLGEGILGVLGTPAVQLLGRASYSIYLAHLVVITLIRGLTDALPPAVGVLVLVVAGTAGGLALYALVEVPVQRAVRARRSSVGNPADAMAGTG